MEHASFAAAYGNERVPAQIFLPRHVPPPYQAVVFFPGGAPFGQPSSPDGAYGDAYWYLFLVRSGRAVVLPVYRSMYERHVGNIMLPHMWRDLMIYAAKDLRRTVDYLETRSDIDAQKLAYAGLSMGAAVGPIMTAVEPRFRASVLFGGGLHSVRQPPEAEAFHFLPRVKVPTLMINGRHDFFYQLDESQRPMFQWLGTPPADKRHLLFDSGHVPTERQDVMRERWIGSTGISGRWPGGERHQRRPMSVAAAGCRLRREARFRPRDTRVEQSKVLREPATLVGLPT